MDAITLLKHDHQATEKLFKSFEKAGERAFVEKRRIVDRIIEELSIHAAIEELVFYPVIRATVPSTESMTLESLEEHHIVKWVLDELDGMDPEDERFDAKVTVLIENVRHHVEEEEGDLFPKVREELGRTALGQIGDALEAAKKLAPTSPHPTSPDTPPGNLVVGVAAGVADRVGDTVSGAAQGSINAVSDLIATILRRERPKVSARGSSRSRRTATSVRDSASDATDAVIDAVRRARQAGDTAEEEGTKTASTAGRATAAATSAARAGAKGTATSARRGAAKAASTAKRGATTTRRKASSGATQTKKRAKKAAAKTAKAARKA